MELGFLFVVLGIICGITTGYNEKKIVDEFMVGAKDMMGVAIVIAIARGASIILAGGSESVMMFGEVIKNSSGGVDFAGTIEFDGNAE
jgi:uncharacterized ion transporter superfamily protein YfcC